MLDTLENEWRTYIADIEKLEDQNTFFKQQGVESLRELLGHVIGWWEEGGRIIKGIVYQPGFDWEDLDTDAFNAELIEKYKKLSDAEVRKEYESARLDMIRLVKELPEEAFTNATVESWLAADVAGHFDEHAANG